MMLNPTSDYGHSVHMSQNPPLPMVLWTLVHQIDKQFSRSSVDFSAGGTPLGHGGVQFLILYILTLKLLRRRINLLLQKFVERLHNPAMIMIIMIMIRG